MIDKIYVDGGTNINIGGTGTMYQTFIDGNEYLFKPGKSRYGDDLMPYRADIQEVGYKVQLLVDPDSAIKCFTGYLRINKKNDYIYGAFQSRIKTIKFPLKQWQYDSMMDACLTEGVKDNLLRESITDYLLCNYDCHGGNFIMNQCGIVLGVDKEQGYKYVDKCPDFIDLNYSPNRIYGEAEPILHTLLKRYEVGIIDLNIESIYSIIDLLDTISDEEYMNIFKEFIEKYNATNISKKELYSVILNRKNNLRKIFTDVFISCIENRMNIDKSDKLIKQKKIINERKLVR